MGFKNKVYRIEKMGDKSSRKRKIARSSQMDILCNENTSFILFRVSTMGNDAVSSLPRISYYRKSPATDYVLHSALPLQKFTTVADFIK